jgi:DNA-binding MarR family transcriptional regulator
MVPATDTVHARFRASYWQVVHNLDALHLFRWEERDLTLPQLRVLFFLRRHPGSTARELAAHLGVRAATVSGIVQRLAHAGLVTRGHIDEDRRLVTLTLTAEGAAVVGEVGEGNRAYLDDLAAALGDDLATVTASLECLGRAIERRSAKREVGRGGTGRY